MERPHGAYKFTRKPDGDILAMNVIEEIHRKLPNTHLVMHGSSSVPQELHGNHQRSQAARMREPTLGRAPAHARRDPSAASRTASEDQASTPDNAWR